MWPTKSYLIFALLTGITLPVSSEETSAGASMVEIVGGVQKLCGGSGSGVDLSVVGNTSVSTSRAVSLVVNGKIAGEATFSKSEWDGVRAMRDDSKTYAQCVQALTPLFVDKFSKKK